VRAWLLRREKGRHVPPNHHSEKTAHNEERYFEQKYEENKQIQTNKKNFKAMYNACEPDPDRCQRSARC
jgi:hypothetical protein